jgi:hypothetical protein
LAEIVGRGIVSLAVAVISLLAAILLDWRWRRRLLQRALLHLPAASLRLAVALLNISIALAATPARVRRRIFRLHSALAATGLLTAPGTLRCIFGLHGALGATALRRARAGAVLVGRFGGRCWLGRHLAFAIDELSARRLASYDGIL